MGVQVHRAQAACVLNADDLRFFTALPRTNNAIWPVGQTFAQIVSERFQMSLYAADSCVVEKFQALLKPMDQRCWSSACFPCKRAAVPTLRKVSIVVRVRNAGP